MKIKPVPPSLLLAALLLTGCSKQKQVEVSNVSSPETITLKSDTETPTMIQIRGVGQIEGEATLTLLLEGEAYKSQSLTGDVDFEWRNDWYAEEAILQYDPGTATSGTLTLEYKFQ